MRRIFSAAVLFGLFLLVGLLGARGQETPTPSPTPSAALGGGLDVDQAIDLIWQGDFDRAEQALQAHLRAEQEPKARAELLVYLAFISNIRKDQDSARDLLREALEILPGLELSPITFPTALRSLVTEARAELLRQLPRPRRGELQPPQFALAPAATPPGVHAPTKWYRRWYVWAGVGAAVTVAILVLRPDHENPPATLTPTPTISPTPTATPTQYIYMGEVLKVGPDELDCAGANGPNRGRTTHSFQVVEPGTPIEVQEVFITVTIRGDYGQLLTSEDIDKRALILIESDGLYAVEPQGPVNYCVELVKNLDWRTEKNPDLLTKVKIALRNDGRLDIVIKPQPDVVQNCGKDSLTCTPFHKVNVEIRYRKLG